VDYITQTLQNFLNLHWIRPEVAVWRTLDTIQLKKIQFKKPMIDLGCGDGTFSFTYFGGKVGLDFDVYSTMKQTTGFYQGRDLYNQKSIIKPSIRKKPKRIFDVGLDWKKLLLEKADKLQMYQLLKKHNLNELLPFKDEKFETIFSNVFYWIPKIKQLLKESERILMPSGKMIILVPDKKLKENLIYHQFISHKYKWAKILDRGIYNNITKHAYSFNDWKKLFKESGLKIEYHSQYLSPKLVKLWSIGMRPYSPYITEMANKLTKKERNKLKKRVINDLTPMLRSYINYEVKSVPKKNCFHCFVLKKQ